MSGKWNVWNLRRSDLRGLVVDEGPEKQARESADRRNAAARKSGMADTAFVALPDGQLPSADDLPAE